MPRKWTTLAAALTATLVMASGLSWADDEDSPLHKLMEQVNAKSLAIKKAIRSPVAYKKAQKDVVKNADALIDLGKKSREFTEPATKQKKSQDEWTRLVDDFVKKTEGFRDTVAKTGTTQDQAKKAFGAVNTSCSACHSVFRVEEDAQ